MKEPKDKRTREFKEWKANQPTKVKLGLGDAIESITKATGIKKVVDALTDDCGCEERKKYLNQFKLPTRAKAKRCFTIEQRKQFADYMTRRTLKGWSREDIIMLIDLYAHVFALQYDVRKLCSTCAGTGKMLKKIDEHLEIVYNETE